MIYLWKHNKTNEYIKERLLIAHHFSASLQRAFLSLVFILQRAHPNDFWKSTYIKDAKKCPLATLLACHSLHFKFYTSALVRIIADYHAIIMRRDNTILIVQSNNKNTILKERTKRLELIRHSMKAVGNGWSKTVARSVMPIWQMETEKFSWQYCEQVGNVILSLIDVCTSQPVNCTICISWSVERFTSSFIARIAHFFGFL